jgi:hypothetical protein
MFGVPVGKLRKGAGTTAVTAVQNALHSRATR